MDCRMTRGIYLRANGEINCYCSTGEQISLAQLPVDDLNFDFITDYYLNGKFVHIRQAFANDQLPFPRHCLKCNYLDPYGKFASSLVEKEIEWVHIEPVFGCNLRCTFCTHRDPAGLKKRRPPHVLPLKLYEKILNDIARADLNIKWMYCSGRGEPTLHPEIWEIVSQAKNLFETNFLVNTNGQQSFQPEIITSGLDKIKLALDSLEQQTYSQYRVGGNVSRILELSRAISQAKEKMGQNNPILIWQKVLFDFNATEQELDDYQQTALSYGVNQLRFVFTWTKGYTSLESTKIKHIFPHIEIMDTYKNSNVSVLEIERLLEQGKDTCADLIAACSKILHWFELGTQTREDYDLYGNLAFSDPRLLQGREKDPRLVHYLQLLHRAFELLARFYQDRGNREAKNIYQDFADQVHTLFKLTSC